MTGARSSISIIMNDRSASEDHYGERGIIWCRVHCEKLVLGLDCKGRGGDCYTSCRRRRSGKMRRTWVSCTSETLALGNNNALILLCFVSLSKQKHCCSARMSLAWYEEIVHRRPMPLASVNLISTKDGEQVLASTPGTRTWRNNELFPEDGLNRDVIQ